MSPRFAIKMEAKPSLRKTVILQNSLTHFSSRNVKYRQNQRLLIKQNKERNCAALSKRLSIFDFDLEYPNRRLRSF